MITKLRQSKPKLIVIGNHQPIIQSILTFDFLAEKEKTSVKAIISNNRKSQKFFWGDDEVLVPVFPTLESAKSACGEADWLVNLASASSATTNTEKFFNLFPDALGAHIFAEGVSERAILELINKIDKFEEKKYVAGPSGVGLLVPGILKLGAIGGITNTQVADTAQADGGVSVICCSGGMTNELIHQILNAGSGVSFAVSYGAELFPATKPIEWFLMAEADSKTETIVYLGELGGSEEYQIAEAIKQKQITKPVVAYIAGHLQPKDSQIQFGHAKALAKDPSETALEKTKALQAVGVSTYETFESFTEALEKFGPGKKDSSGKVKTMEKKRKTLFSAPTQVDRSSENFTGAILKRLLMQSDVSKELVEFSDTVFQELIDHGPQVSGAVNTMVATRAGRDMVSSLTSGLLTIGDRFGGAINGSAQLWLDSIAENTTAQEVVSEASRTKKLLPGIGHLKYSKYKPDPRIAKFEEIADKHLTHKKYYTFAKEVADLTTQKKASLILNVDGAIAALLLDYLTELENYSEKKLQDLIETEFFNSFFVLARSVGLVGTYLDQKRIDEGLFRLPDDNIHYFEPED